VHQIMQWEGFETLLSNITQKRQFLPLLFLPSIINTILLHHLKEKLLSNVSTG